MDRKPRADDDDIPAALRQREEYAGLRRIGGGGMGNVYVATNRLMARQEALKVVALGGAGDADRFLQEIRSAAQLVHPNVAVAYAALKLDDDSLALAMEYLPTDLAKTLQAEGPLSVAAACNYAAQAALGLQAAHDKGMVHRDIKPSNLLLDRSGPKPMVKIADFGMAKVVSETVRTAGLTGDRVMGTPEYMAPEQWLGAARADIRADLYALGATLFHLLAGRPPFTAEGLFEMGQAHQSAPPPDLAALRPDVPAELAALVARLLAKDPAERYQTPGEVARALATFTKSKAVPPTALSPAAPPADEAETLHLHACPKCGAKLKTPSSRLGKKVECGRCRTVSLVPETAPLHEPKLPERMFHAAASFVGGRSFALIGREFGGGRALAPLDDDSEAPAARRRRRRRSSWKTPALAGLAVVGVVAAVVAITWPRTSANDEPLAAAAAVPAALANLEPKPEPNDASSDPPPAPPMPMALPTKEPNAPPAAEKQDTVKADAKADAGGGKLFRGKGGQVKGGKKALSKLAAKDYEGRYRREPSLNDEHEGELKLDSAGPPERFRWTNKAGKSWLLTADFANAQLVCDPGSPHWDAEEGKHFKLLTKRDSIEVRAEFLGFGFHGSVFKRVASP